MAVVWSPVTDQPTQQQAGVFIIRIWKEPDTASGFRARIIRTLDLSSPQEVISAASTVETVRGAVEQWITEFVSSE